jgi:hypothetical protein
MELDEPQSRSGSYGEEKNLASVGNQTPVVQPSHVSGDSFDDVSEGAGVA